MPLVLSASRKARCQVVRHIGSMAARPLAAMAFGRKEQARVPMGFPLLAQKMEGALGQRHVTVLVALAGADMQEPAFGVDVGNLETQALTQSEPAGVDRSQTHPMIQSGDDRKDA